MLQNIQILYCSQTGKSVQYSEELLQTLKELNFSVKLDSILNYDKIQFSSQTLFIFLMSTTGNGDPPEDGIEFKKFLKFILQKSQKQCQMVDFDQQFKFFMFGLGDSKREKYNYHSQLMVDYMKQLNKELISYIKGDIRNDQPKSFQDFQFEVVQYCNQNCSISSNINSSILIPQYDFQTQKQIEFDNFTILNVQQIRQSEKYGKTYHVQICLNDKNVQYNPGQNIEIFPVNKIEDVQFICKEVLQTDPEQQINIQLKKMLFKSNEKLHDILLQYIDFKGEITYKTYKNLQEIVANQKNDKEFLFNQDVKNLQTYTEHKQNKQISIINLLREHQIQLTVEQFFKLVVSMKPRTYTISSSQSVHQNEIQLTISQVKNGLMGNFLEDYIEHRIKDQSYTTQLKCRVIQSSFILDLQCQKQLFIGTGSGIAPFRGFLQELNQQQQYKGQIQCLFGFKEENGDNLYNHEFQSYQNEQIKINYAFSQTNKIHVQNLIKIEDLENVDKIMICGHQGMGNAVKEKINQLKNQNNLEKLDLQKILIEEVW